MLALLLVLGQTGPLNLNQQPIMVRDEGVAQSTVRASTINCTGAGVTCTQAGTTMTVNVAGGGGGGVTSVTASAPLNSSGGATPNVSLTGTVPQANGGTGAGALTCPAGQALTSNGTAYSCTATLTATQLAANPTDCAGGQFANAIDAQGNLTCATPAGGGSANTVEASVVLTSAGYFTTTVTGQAWVTSTSRVACTPFGTTADGLTPEAIAVAGLVVSVSSYSAGVGFAVNVYSPHGLAGTVRLHCTGA